MLRQVAIVVTWALLCAALFYSGGLHFLVVSAYNIALRGFPLSEDHWLWKLTLPLSSAVGKLNGKLLQDLPEDSSGVKEIAGLPFFFEALPMFLVAVAIEVALTLLKGEPWYSYQDTISSLSAGLLNQTGGAVLRYFTILPYMYIHEHFRLADLSEHRTLLWVVTFVGIDFAYYWFHRLAHELNVLWAMHEVHHSSEEYNLSTALRQTVFAGVDGFVFYLPLAPFVPPSVANSHKMFNLMYQFWIHTRHVPKLPWPVELIFNTPSHHRVHHGRNPWCIDCNYGGTLIVWDRLFGTFREEREDDPIAYGILPPLASWDPWAAQVHHHADVVARMAKTPALEAPKHLVTGPGMYYLPKSRRWKAFPVPELGSKVNPLPTPPRALPAPVVAYTSLCFVALGAGFFAFILGPAASVRPVGETASVAAFVATAVWTMGAIHDRRPVAALLEPLRAAIAAAILFAIAAWPRDDASGSLRIPASLSDARPMAETAAADLMQADWLTKGPVLFLAAQAVLAALVLPLFVAETQAEADAWTAALAANRSKGEVVFKARTAAAKAGKPKAE